MAGVNFSKYFGSLKWPDNWKDFVDLLSKTVVASVSAIVGVIVWEISHIQEAETKKRAATEAERSHQLDEIQQTIDNHRQSMTEGRETITLFLTYMPKDSSDPQLSLKLNTLNSYCQTADNSDTISIFVCKQVSDFSSTLAGETKQKAAEVAQNGSAENYITSNSGAAQTAALAGTESNGGAIDPSAQWFAVMASVPLSQASALPSLLRSFNARLGKAGMPEDARVYKTKISSSYAITSGDLKSQALAVARARALRQAGVVPDAFAQPDREWVFVQK
ncbi:MAG TPA: hypothetical protein VG839_06180 [Asticcacaulis sp.]|nr:hypothetical protein [Asticcacaulis sp.]